MSDSNPYILVVDDSATDRRLVEAILTRESTWSVAFAGNGRQALESIEGRIPDLVITDMQMPEMNGLELVTELNRMHPALPVMLITSQGSEELAMQALEAGAASYSPKRLLATDLACSAKRLLDHVGESKRKQNLLERMVHCRYHFALENDTSLIAPLVELLQNKMVGWDDADRLRTGVAIDESLLNAMYHGNLEVSSTLREENDEAFYNLIQTRQQQSPYRERRVQVVAEFLESMVTITIDDEGPGFEPDSLPDPTDPENLDKVSGRGLLLIRTFMSEVRFNKFGNQITLIKRKA